MAVTRLKRKGKRNIVKAKNKKKIIQRLKAIPVIKNVDIESVKAEFAKASPKAEVKEVKEIKEIKEIESETKVERKPAQKKSGTQTAKKKKPAAKKKK